MASQLAAYTYRNSGIEWLGEIPEHWEVMSLRRLISSDRPLTYGIVQPGRRDETGRYMVRGQDYSFGWAKPESLFRVSEAIEVPYKRSRLRSGDLVMTIVGAGVGNVAVIPDWLNGANITQTTARIAVDQSNAAPNFVRSVLEGPVGQRSVGFYAKGAAQPGLNLEHVKLFPVIAPPLDEQTQIAKFLDYETAKIDALIEKQQQLIALLKEKRQAVISHAVTKGLNPDAPMRDSGVEWLGEVPAHWEVKRLKHISPKIGVGLVINPSTYTRDEGAYFIFGGDVKEHRFDLTNTRRISPEDSNRLPPSKLYAGDLLSVRVGDPGITAVVPPELEGANCASVIIIRRGDFDSNWLCSAMNSWVGRQQVGLVAYGAAQKQFNVADAVEFVFPVPPREEQEAIAQFIADKSQRFEALSRSATDAVELLQERRTALISAAVTGKIDVRNWSAPDD